MRPIHPPPSPAIPSSPSPPAAHHVYEELRIEGGAYFGDFCARLHPGLNCFIGGSGGGKTTSLQSIRYSVGAPATDPRADRNDKQVCDTLGHGTLIATARTKHGARYTSKRKWNEPCEITCEDGSAAKVTFGGELFRLDFYAQNEIQGIAEDPAAQLALIDKFAPAEIAALEEKIGLVEGKLTTGSRDVARLDAEIAELADRTAELPTIAAALTTLSDAAGPNADEARRADEAKVLRGREKAMLRAIRDELRAVVTSASVFETDARRRLGGELAAPLEASANRATLERVQAGARAALGVIQDSVARARTALAEAESNVTTAGDLLSVAHTRDDAAYEALCQKHQVDRGRIAERDRLQRRLLDLEALDKKLSERRREHAAAVAEVEALIEERAHLLQTQVAVRQRVGKEITAKLEDRVRVAVVAGGDPSAYIALLTDILHRSGTRQELVRAIAENIRPEDLVAGVRAKDSSRIQAVDEAKTNKVERARKVVGALRASGRLHELDVVRLRDVPVIRLQVGTDYVLSSELSFGQRCMAVFPIILILSDAPLIVDQPEDQLDNAFIYNVLVPTLLLVKRVRQIIFASHNPNIIVLAESDRVFVMRGTRTVGRLAEWGTIDEVRGSIEQLVEGGREAFLRRSERYGHAPSGPPGPGGSDPSTP